MADSELSPTETQGYKVSDKKTIEELQKLDSNDESLKKWKESLGLKSYEQDSSTRDPRKVVVLSMSLLVESRPDAVMDLTNIDAVEKQYFILKEGVEYRFSIKFRVQNDVVCGLKYLHIVKKSIVTVDKTEEMLGSYGPSAEPYEKIFLPEEAPSGMMARGKYTVKSKFIDDDKVPHLEWTWGLEIKKDWE